MNAHGEQVGGAIGFLRTLRKLVNEFKPKQVYIAWEGGGSTRRRALYSEYKMNRRPDRLNRFYEDDIPDTEENKMKQMVHLLKYLKCLPVYQLYAADCEGDDVIAYLVEGPLRDKRIIIASADKDMYQLIKDSVNVYSFHRKKFITQQDVFDEFRVASRNFAIAKALCGDTSDNIPGVKGLGFKTLVKKLPMMGTKDQLLLQEIFDYCSAHKDESLIFQRILDSADDVRRNYRLVYLDAGTLSPTQINRIDNTLNTFSPSLDRMALMKLIVADGIPDFDVIDYVSSFSHIVAK
jgi:5'-3' exonuclease